jgi:hypothetical protein
MKKFVLRLSVVATASVQILSCNLSAQTLMLQSPFKTPPANSLFCTAMAPNNSAHDEICLAQQ